MMSSIEFYQNASKHRPKFRCNTRDKSCIIWCEESITPNEWDFTLLAPSSYENHIFENNLNIFWFLDYSEWSQRIRLGN